MRYFFTLILFLAASLWWFSDAQILNAESLRKATDTSGFSGSASLDFALKRNTRNFTTFSSDIHVQYKMEKHLVLLKSDLAFQKIEGSDVENSSILHLRYNYKLSDRFTWEAFSQLQNNKINLIDLRALAGTGVRYKLTTSEKYRFYIGTLAMYEHEKLDDGVTPIQKNLRNSSYVSFSLYPNENVSIISTTYYQPILENFSDYRISNQSSLRVGMFKNVSLKVSYTFTYDTFPAVGIPSSQYDFSTGLSYSFD
jgi:putative salt-induced outer membrane protein YdiY